jgi:hypothetical protein
VAAALDALNAGGHQTDECAQRHDGAGPVKPAPGDPQLFDPIGRLALGKPPKLRIHRLGKRYGSDHDQRDQRETDPGQDRCAMAP